PEISEYYGVNLQKSSSGFIVIDVRRVDPISRQESVYLPSLLALLGLLSMFGGTGCVIIYCIWCIGSVLGWHYFKMGGTKIFSKYKKDAVGFISRASHSDSRPGNLIVPATGDRPTIRSSNRHWPRGFWKLHLLLHCHFP
ncbi:hypothetical protein PMAYCL1PPCAC_11500, partial [Pristionchus mayeri]